MTNGGWIKMHRRLMEKGYYQDSEYVHLWLHLLFKASHDEKEFLFNGRTERLKPGEFITGRLQLAKETGIHPSKVERVLKTFEIEQQIEQQNKHKFRLIKVKKWSQYQKIEQQIEQPVNSQRTASEHNQEGKELKNIRKRGGNFVPPTLQELVEYCTERKNEIKPQKFLDFYASKGWFVGKNKMKDWKAAVRTWEQRDEPAGKNDGENKKQRQEYEDRFFQEHGYYPPK